MASIGEAPHNRLLRRIRELEAENERLRKLIVPAGTTEAGMIDISAVQKSDGLLVV